MNHLIVELSKYLLIVMMICYVFCNFYYFSKKTERGRNYVVNLQIFFMLFIHFLGFLILYLNTEDMLMLLFYAMQLAFFVAYLFIYPEIYRRVNRQLVVNSALLMAVGLIMQTRLEGKLAFRQLVLILVAAAASLLIPLVISHGEQVLYRCTWLYGIAGILALSLVFAGGDVEYGAKLSIKIGGISLQLSEFAKITYVFFVAGMLQKSRSFGRVFLTSTVAAVHVLLLVLSKDLGAALIFYVAYVLIIYVATEKLRYVAAGVGMGMAASVAAYQLFGHVQVRVAAWLDPWADVTGSGWQIVQSLFAVGSGKWLGSGLYQGMPYKIPVPSKDFIFSAVAEEMGAIFAIGMILVCLGTLISFLWISTWMKQVFLKIVAFGLAAVYGVQVFLNIGGVLKLLPSTGITLPFVSYGGSSVLSTFILFGVMQGLYIMKQKEDEKVE